MPLTHRVVRQTGKRQHPQYGKSNNAALARGNFIFQTVETMPCPMKQSGNTQAGRARILPLHSADAYPQTRATMAASVSCLQTVATCTALTVIGLSVWQVLPPTRGGFLICTEMFRSGARTGTAVTPHVLFLIPKGRPRARTA